MENCGFDPIELRTVSICRPWYEDQRPGGHCRQLASVYHRLTWCRECLRCLRCGNDIEETLRELVSRLVSQTSPRFVRGFRHLTDTMSIAERRRLSEKYQKTVLHAIEDLPERFDAWTDAEQRWHEEDLPLQQAILIHAKSHRVVGDKGKKEPVPPLKYSPVATRDPRRPNGRRTRMKVVKPDEVTHPAPRRSARVQSRRCSPDDAEAEKRRNKRRRVVVAYLELSEISRAARRVKREMDCRT